MKTTNFKFSILNSQFHLSPKRLIQPHAAGAEALRNQGCPLAWSFSRWLLLLVTFGCLSGPGSAAEFQSVDIVMKLPPGTTTVLEPGRSYEVAGYGRQFSYHEAHDSGRFVYRRIQGDFDITVQVSSITHERGFEANAGLMARASLEPDAMHAQTIVANNPEPYYFCDAFMFAVRFRPRGMLAHDDSDKAGFQYFCHKPYQTPPSVKKWRRDFPHTWVRLKREGNRYSGYFRERGAEWILLGEREVDLGPEPFVGLALAANPERKPDGRAVARFDHLAGFPAEDPAARPAFPLKVSENRRYLVDSGGKPFLVVGDTAWSLIAQLNEADIAQYLDDRQRRGFNSIIVNLIEHKYASKAPAKIDGVAPFLKPGYLTQPNPAYFDYAHRAVAEANKRGITVWLCPAYLGAHGGDEGFFKEIKAAGPAALRSYGRFVGERFKDLPNIVWMPGGDYALPEAERWTGNELAEGLREGGARQIMTAHGGQTSAIETFGEQPWLEVDNVYRYQPDLWRPLRANYPKLPVRPFVLIETTYEGEHKATPELIRRLAWWAMLSGACGQFYGNNPMWHFDGPGLHPVDTPWQEALDSAGSRDMARLGMFFNGQPWPQLVPDVDDKLVSAGRGNGATQVTAAHTPGHRLALFYIPADVQGPRELTLNLTAFPGPVTAHWFNPAKDAALIAHGPAMPNQDGQRLRTPGDNGTGTNDWVLVLEGGIGK